MAKEKEILLMLRVWQTKNEYQASLKNIKTKEVQYFKTIESLNNHLNDFTNTLEPKSKPPEEEKRMHKT